MWGSCLRTGLMYFTHPVGEYDDGMAIPSYVESTDASH